MSTTEWREGEREGAKISQPSSPSPITSSFLHLNPIRVLMRRSIAHTPVLDSPQSNMDSIKFQLRSNNPSPLRSISRISLLNWKQLRGNLIIFVSISVILAVFCYLLLFSQNSHKKKYWIVIDGGSTGTRIHVFEYLVSNGGSSSFDFGKEELGSMKVNPGLSSFERNPGSAGNSLMELLEFGKQKVPVDYWGETEIRLMATAGLRRLDVGVIEGVLESCRSVLRSSGFKFQDDWASVITGSDEGIYAWVAANYALGTLGGDPRQTTGIVELGGASAQVTFVPSEPFPSEFAHKLKFGKLRYNLYSHSLLNFGQNIAYESLRELLISKDLKLSAGSLRDEIFVDPCTPSGYLYSMESENFSPGALDEKNKYLTNLHARGNFSECRSAALMVLQKGKDKCSYQSCSIGSTFIPKLQGKFLATENFFYTSKFFGLAPTTFLSNMELAGQQFCHEDWSKLQKKYHTFNKEDLLHYCFSSAYIVALLHDSLGIALDDERIEFANQVGNIPLDWALGAFILQNMADSNHPDWISTIITDDSSTFFSIFVISTILIFTAWLVTKWRNPQLKTIYDLEKGRYIVTRVSRS